MNATDRPSKASSTEQANERVDERMTQRSTRRFHSYSTQCATVRPTISYSDAGIFVHAACWITCAFLNSKSLAFDRPLMVAWSKVAWLLVSNHTDDPQNSKDLEIFRFFSTYDCWHARSFLIACSLARQLKSYSLFSLATKRRIGSCKKDEHWWRSPRHSSPAKEWNFLKKN